MPNQNLDKTIERRAYRVNEACAAFRISRSTVYKLMKSGALRTVLVGGRRLIPAEAAEALLSGGAQ
jgi:excisionase family DNA binding protein